MAPTSTSRWRSTDPGESPPPPATAYSPQIVPQEHLWGELREKEFPNRVFAEMAGVLDQLAQGLPRLAADIARVRNITAWMWIVSLYLNAYWNQRTGWGLGACVGNARIAPQKNRAGEGAVGSKPNDEWGAQVLAAMKLASAASQSMTFQKAAT
ncbi:MAG: hypothetical protein RL077_3125 [Verrucomicrobiota bacterium]